jgi:glycine cleavage system aminomethyltransferase T
MTGRWGDLRGTCPGYDLYQERGGGARLWRRRVDGQARCGRVRSGGYGYTVGKTIGFAYLPVELAGVGTPLEVECFAERLLAWIGKSR